MTINAVNKGEVLIPIARQAISESLGHDYEIDFSLEVHSDWLHEHGACFVTLTQTQGLHGEQLRGCIGSLEAHRKLLDDVISNARAAAFRDPRFVPLTRDELANTNIEISLLSAMQDMEFDCETDALQQIRPGIDGIVFESRHYRSTFLPQVWEQLPTVNEFMQHLKRKAGLPSDYWSDDVTLQRYTVSKWKEQELAKHLLDKVS
jgi:AmmeMemoRadiSam system protein A